jgi:uncharacterized protein
LSRLTMF